MRKTLFALTLATAAMAGPATANENIALHVKVTNGQKVLVDTTLLTTAGEQAQARIGKDIKYVSSTTTYARAKTDKGLPAPPAERTYGTVFDGVEISVTPELTGTGATDKVVLRTRVSLSRLKKMDHAGEGQGRIDLPEAESFRTQSNSAVAWGAPQVITYKAADKEGADDYRIEVTPGHSQVN